ncbi:MAG: hypothetical protein RL324_1063 [Verrucomicrobiota bacterium]|jgi:uncharacterized membrane protein YdjX (TVP38/TMEM64 family)
MVNPHPTMSAEKPSTSPEVPKGTWAHVVGFYRAMAKLGPAGFLTAAASMSPPIGGFVILGFVPKLGPWISSHGTIGAVLFSVAFWFLGGFALVPTYAYSGLAGWTFGIGYGFFLCMVAYAGASLVAYWLAGWLAGDRAVQMIDASPKWKAVIHALVGGSFWRTVWVIAVVRAPPTSPFSFVCYLMSMVRIPIGTYLFGTLLGLAPRTLGTIIMFASGRELYEHFDANRPKDNWLSIGGIILTLIAIYVVTRIAQNALKGVTGDAKG